ncbi:MAG TPA: EAL domain-containing protein [Gammaproteobacteria bacterium]|nr:EAL domain-containing protein [Gammaproteobacteria bacterium]
MNIANDNRPLRGLFRFLMLLVVAVYLVAVAKLWRDNLDANRVALTHVNSMLVQGVRTTLKGHELILRGLGGQLVSMGALDDPARGRELVERMRDIDPGMVGFGLARPDGQLVLVSGIPDGEPLPNLAARDPDDHSFDAVTKDDALRVGRPYFFARLGRWVVPIRVPIHDAAGMMVAVMTAGYTIEGGTTAWSNIALPPAVRVVLLGDEYYPVYLQPLIDAPRDEALRQAYGQPIAAGTRDQIATLTAPEGFVRMYLPRLGSDHYVAYSRLPEYDLYAAAFVPRAAIIDGWLQRLLMPTAMLLVVVAGGALGYRRAASRQAASQAEVGRLTAWQQAVLDGAEYSIISTDRDGVIVGFNRAAQRMLGYSPDEVVGRHTPAIIHDPDEVERRAVELSAELGEPVEAGFEVFVARARRGRADEREWTYVRKDGSRFPVRLSVTPLVAADGQVIGFMGIAADLSEQQAIRADLRDSEARYQVLFERAGDSIFVVRDGHFVDCNAATLAMFGCTREQIIGSTPDAHSPPLQPDGHDSHDRAMGLIAAAASGRVQFFEWQHRRCDGSLFDAEVSLNAVEIAGQRHLIATVRDVSARKRDEAELDRWRQEVLARNESLRLLNGLSQRLHGTRGLDGILQETGAMLLGLSGTPHVAIYLLDRERGVLELAFDHGFEGQLTQFGATLPLAGSLSGLALQRGEPLCTSDIAGDERVEPALRDPLLRVGTTSGVVVPLIWQGEPLGTINLAYERACTQGDIERETLASLSNTVALAIINVRHLDSLAFQARHDVLTGLANRARLHERFEEIAERTFEAGGEVALLLLDLNHFKEINDTLGHHIGDRVLTQIGPRLREFCGDRCDLISRLGGDEFAVLVCDGPDGEGPTGVAHQVAAALDQPFLVEGIQVRLGASVGVACYPEHGSDSHALLRAADVAMYQAKQLSQGVCIYNYQSDEYSTERLALANELVQAVCENQLLLHYQPKIDIASGLTVGFEALVRWQHPRRGLLYPGAFIDLVEMSEVVHPFTAAVVDLAIAEKRRLRDLGFVQPVAVNLSARNLLDERCLATLEDALARHGVPAAEVELELTETAVMHDPDGASEMMRRFTDLGMKASIDDFGTGYSSLVYLRKLPISALKIDRSFVSHMLDNEQDRSIVGSTVALAHNLNLGVVAEGVEDDETLALLREMGCDQAQGFGLCRPKPLDQLIEWLSSERQTAASG